MAGQGDGHFFFGGGSGGGKKEALAEDLQVPGNAARGLES